MDEIATLRGPSERLQQVIRETALAPAGADAVYPLVRFELAADGVAAATPGVGSGPAFAVRYEGSFFDAYEGPEAPRLGALGREATLRWLDWLGSETGTVAFLSDDGPARAAEIRDAEYEVEVSPLPTDVVDADLDSGRPQRFEDGVLVRDGEPAATRIETDAAALERLAEAAAIVDDEGVPVVVADGEFRLAVTGDEMRGEGTLPATVAGPDCRNRYGPGLAAIARTLTGPVELQVVPNGPLAVVQDEADASRRYVLEQTL